jgi:hypothetical protein
VTRRILGRLLERCRDLLGRAAGEQTRLEIEWMVVRRHLG